MDIAVAARPVRPDAATLFCRLRERLSPETVYRSAARPRRQLPYPHPALSPGSGAPEDPLAGTGCRGVRDRPMPGGPPQIDPCPRHQGFTWSPETHP